MPPRQKTTFKKGQKKGTTTYRDYNPAQERANAQLERFIRDNPEGDRRNTEQSPEVDVVTSMPVKFQKSFTNKNGILDIPNYSDMNQQQKYLFGIYDNVNKYQRDMNNLRTSSPEMRQAYARRFPVANFMMETAPKFLPSGVGALFAADRGMKANAEKQRIMNTPVNKPDGGFKNFVDFFAKGMTPDQAKNTEVISGETLRLAPQDIFNKSQPMTEEQKANVAADSPFRSPQDMGFLDDENIFDSEKAAIDEALPTGDVFDPVAADKQSKVDFINQVENTNMTVEDAERSFKSYGKTIDDMFERSKQKQGGIIREEVNRDLNVDDEDPIPGGQFNLTRPTVNEDTVPVILGGDPNYEYDNYEVNQQLGDVLPTDNMFPEGGVSGNFVDNIGSGTQMIGDNIFASEPGSQSAFDTLNSNADPYFSGQPTMGFGFADGGSTNKYENMSTHEKLMRMAAEMYG